jgi:hypothetical protein
MNLAQLHEAIAQAIPERECLVFRERRSSESRRATVSDRPLLLGVTRTLPELVVALGAPARVGS